MTNQTQTQIESEARVLGADTIEIDGVVYNVIERHTAEEIERRSPAIAEWMRDVGIAAQLVIKRPNGRRSYHTHAFENGRFHTVIAL